MSSQTVLLRTTLTRTIVLYFMISDVCQSLRCLVACCGSQVLIDLRDAIEEYQKQTSNEEDEEEEEEQEPKESTFRETVL